MPRPSPTWFLLPVIVVAAVHLRTTFIQPVVAPPDTDHVRFLGNDAWYHMRVVDHLLAQWPNRLRLDPFSQYPDPAALPVAPLFDYLVAGALRIAGLDSADPVRRDLAAAWIPPLLGAAVCLPAFLIGRRVFGRAAGLTAAAWLAVMPGSFLRRSLLGFTDHHVAEVLFSTLAMWLLLGSIARRTGGRRAGLRTAAWTAAFGLALAAYLLTWVGGVYFLGVLGCCIVAVRMFRHLRGDDRPLTLPVAAGVVIAWAAMFPMLDDPLMKAHVPPLLTMGVTVVLLDTVAALGRRWSVPRAAYPAAAFVAGLLVWWALDAIAPWVLGPTVDRIRESVSTGAELTVAEARPATWTYVLPTFGIATVLAPLGLLLVAARFRRSGSDARLVLAVWSVATLIAMLRQQRFAYYLAVPVALLCGYIVARAGGAAGRLIGRAIPRGARRRNGEESTPPPWVTVPAGVLVGALLFAPNFAPAVIQASAASGPDRGWYDALVWLREETPPPLGRPDRYLARYRGGREYRPPDSAYGVLAAWERGYWIMRIGQRIPNANPTQHGALRTARFLTAERPVHAAGMLRKLGTRYVVLDDSLPLRPTRSGDVTGELVSQAEWAGMSARDWVERYEVPTTSGRDPMILYRPEYFRTMAVRLFTFDGRAARPSSSTVVVSYEEGEDPATDPRRAVAIRRFETYEEAEAYRASLPGSHHSLGSTDPGRSCVPLSPLRGYSLVYESPDSPRGERISRVKIFEFSDPMRPSESAP
ncbi:MAG TPA: STT3 domain-containing protein [bacterium]|nr:STT3 domain-containing protein [bacterium]